MCNADAKGLVEILRIPNVALAILYPTIYAIEFPVVEYPTIWAIDFIVVAYPNI
jgi:hypothetical protein